MKSTLLALLFVFSFLTANLALAPLSYGADEPLKATVYKSPTCDCCSRWEDHLRQNGFAVDSHPTTDMVAVKSKNHVPVKARSCHTAIIGNYVVEGHVPADAIKRLIKEHPAGVVGIAVPRMPIGSPGMEGADPKNDSEHYDIVTFDAQGKTKVFEHR